MKKYILDLQITESISLHAHYILLKATPVSGEKLPEMLPGQFAELRIDGSPTTFLRRPISINFVDEEHNEIWFLIQLVGAGTCRLAMLRSGDILNVILPLGKGFTLPGIHEKVLLIGGGVGSAPLLYWGNYLQKVGITPRFLLGGRSTQDILQRDLFEKIGIVDITTEDGSAGEQGVVTQHTVLQKMNFDRIYTCGPKPMMMAVARYAHKKNIFCEVSLENTMACGLGACLCCVENTTAGNVCVCKDGPVFNINELLWQI
ncbi:MAG: dihydroorotate dehydrogenase electron transfer subunit [Porphyromonadaceae bacterium]|nr:dihydroorotate dehydrogenase electron transfer subunit [Porphyromonadaceae bacterium]